MKVVKYPGSLPKGKKTLVLGAFNSFHNGHKKLIDIAKETKQPVVVMVIEGISTLHNKSEELTSLDIRLQQFANYDVDYVVVIDFKDVTLMKGLDFLKDISDKTGATMFVGGKDFAMGHNRDLKIQDIKEAIVVPPEKISDKKISSTILRELVETGDVKLIRSLAPFFYQTKAHVDSKNNVTGITQIVPHPGIYSVFVEFNEVRYPGTLHISMDKKLKISVPDLQIVNASYDPIISFVELVRKIYKDTNDKVMDGDKEKVIISLSNSNTYL